MRRLLWVPLVLISATPVSADILTLDQFLVTIPVVMSHPDPSRGLPLPVGTVAFVDHFTSAPYGSNPAVTVNGLTADPFALLTSADYRGARLSAPLVELMLTTTLALDAETIVSGAAFFYNGDFVPQETASVRLLDASGALLATVWQQTSGGLSPTHPNTIPFDTVTPWQSWAWTAPGAGVYTLVLGLHSSGDLTFPSAAGFSPVTVTPVPEPGTLALACLGLVTLLRQRRTLTRGVNHARP